MSIYPKCADCNGDITKGNYVRWSKSLWHYHCFMHRMSCTTCENLLLGVHDKKAYIVDLSQQDQDTLNKWLEVVRQSTHDLLHQCRARFLDLENQIRKLPTHPAYKGLRVIMRKEVSRYRALFEGYDRIAGYLVDPVYLDQTLIFSLWLFAHAQPIYYLDRGI